MSNLINVLSIVLIGIAVLAVLGSLAIALGALVPLFTGGARARLTTLSNAADLWRSADKRLQGQDADWTVVGPTVGSLARISTRELETSIASIITRAP